MAMNKKEQAEMAALKRQVLVNRALRWTDPVARDLPPPKSGGDTVTQGFDFNEHRGEVLVAWSGSVYHGYGVYVPGGRRSASQNARNLYSTELRALLAMRAVMEQQFADRLANVDEQIAAQRAKETA